MKEVVEIPPTNFSPQKGLPPHLLLEYTIIWMDKNNPKSALPRKFHRKTKGGIWGSIITGCGDKEDLSDLKSSLEGVRLLDNVLTV